MATSPEAAPGNDLEHLDVLVVGAGISGICAAHHQRRGE
jgi:cation diffusion facilitator CzcD-associated flavoprotein CzcO